MNCSTELDANAQAALCAARDIYASEFINEMDILEWEILQNAIATGYARTGRLAPSKIEIKQQIRSALLA